MDWQQLISAFQPLTPDEVMLFAPPREMEQAISAFNRAIFNLNHDSADIALIALRKLVTTYPMFAQATLLLGYCQARLGQYDEALEQFAHAQLAGMPDEWQEQVQLMQAEAQNQRQLRSQLLAGGSAGVRTPLVPSGTEARRVPAGAVLEKSRRRSRVRMASEKERQAVIRQGEQPETQQTAVKITREPIEYLRLAIPALAGLLVIAFLVFAGIRWLPGLIRGARQRRESAVRLEWLLQRLDGLAGQNTAIDQLLKDYQAFVAPTPTPAPVGTTAEPTVTATQAAATTAPSTAATAAVTTAAATTTAPTATAMPTTQQTSGVVTPAANQQPTPAPAADPAGQALQQADRHYQQAQSQQSADLIAAADNLLAARGLLAGIPARTTAPGVTGDAAAVSLAVERLITNLSQDAAEAYRVIGMDLFNQQNYQSALPNFIKAYQVFPKAYGGGVAYYCGRCYQLLGDKAAAKPYYEFVLANFAGRDIAVSASYRLTQMGY